MHVKKYCRDESSTTAKAHKEDGYEESPARIKVVSKERCQENKVQ
jgi:hypothetical protein